MEYREYKDGIKLSRLGMGNMRLPVKADVEGRPIDYEKAKAIIDRAYKMGVNYYDTAYIYHGGESEVFTGRALAEYPRDSYYVADKYNLDAEPDYTKQFPEQLRRLNLDRIDFYLLHGVMDHNVDTFAGNGCFDYFDRMKAEGKIRYFGFSFHGTPAALRRMVAMREWDFVQIQLNYYDWFFGNAKELYDILDEAGIPIMVMEPVRGGLLAKLNDAGAAVLKNAAPEKSLASWALRWVKELERVQVVLSGMTEMEQMNDNLATFADETKLTEAEHAVIREGALKLRDSVAVPCTGCRYCTDGCPMALDIPRMMLMYNEAKLGGAWRLSGLNDLAEDKLPAACIACGTCTGVCPQSIDIPGYMQKLAEMMKK